MTAVSQESNDSRPRPPRVWTAFLAFVAVMLGHAGLTLILSFTLALVAGQPVSSEQFVESISRPAVFLPFMTLMVAMTLAVAMLPALASPVYLRDRMRLSAPGTPWWAVGLMVVGTLACSWMIWAGVHLLGNSTGKSLGLLAAAIGQFNPWQLAIGVVVIGEIGPISEELLFRGYIQTRLTQRWSPVVGVSITALLFGLLHLDWVQSAFAVGLGLFLGYVTERADSIWPAVGGHALNNTVSVVLIYRNRELALFGTMPWVILVACAVVLGACLWGIASAPAGRVSDSPA